MPSSPCTARRTRRLCMLSSVTGFSITKLQKKHKSAVSRVFRAWAAIPVLPPIQIIRATGCSSSSRSRTITCSRRPGRQRSAIGALWASGRKWRAQTARDYVGRAIDLPHADKPDF